MNVHSMQVLWLDEQPEVKIQVTHPRTDYVSDRHRVAIDCHSTNYSIILSTPQLRTLHAACAARLAEVDAEGVAS